MASVEGVDGEFSPSHKHVELSGGLPTEFKFHYVDEAQCIGCTWCADVARNTFFMESERGRGRVFRQHGDSVDVIQEAIACCPVNAIHGLSWEQLVSSENLREENARLVTNNPGHLYRMAGQGLFRSRSHAESRGHVIVGRALTEEEEQERAARATDIKAEKRRASAEALELADVPNLQAMLDALAADPCEDPDASECALLLDPCVASPESEECALMTGTGPPALDAALLEEGTYGIEDPCDADPLGEECQVFTRDPGLVLMDYDASNFEVADPCEVADAPFACENDTAAEKLIAAIYRDAKPSFA
jgi:ferredoxin